MKDSAPVFQTTASGAAPATGREGEDFQTWLAEEIERAKDECRRIAKRDGIPPEAIEAVFEKLKGGNAGTA